jgi:hypothetical protein
MKIGPIDLLVDTGTILSITTQPMGPFSQRHVTIAGAMGDQTHCPFLISRKCSLGKHEVKHESSTFLIALWP